jgi:2-methylcitrate dehydratase PrpD
MVNALGQEETHLVSGTHPAETTVPTVLALGELVGSTGMQVLEALAIGMEVTPAIASMSLTPAVKYERGQAPSVYGTIGAVASAAKLLGLDEAQTANALSLGANFAAGLAESILAGTGEYHYLKGLVAMHANLAVRLARSGAIAAPRAFEGHGGFYHLFNNIAGAAMDDFDVAGDIGSRLGSQWTIPDFIYKPYPVNYFNLDFVDAAKMLQEKHHLKSSDVRSIRIEIGERASKSGGLGAPPFTDRANTVSATQFCVAAIIARGHLTLEDQLDYTASDIIDLCDLTEVVAVEGLSTARITINTVDGVIEWDAAEGTRDYRLGDDDVYKIFREAAGRALPVRQVNELLDVLIRVDAAPSLSEVLRLTHAYPGAA